MSDVPATTTLRDRILHHGFRPSELAYINDALAERVAALDGADDVRVITHHGKPVAVIADYRHFRNLEDGFFPDDADPVRADRVDLLLDVAEKARHVHRALSGSEVVEELGDALAALNMDDPT